VPPGPSAGSVEIRAAAALGRAAWPTLSLSEDAFAGQIAELLSERPETSCADLRLADLYLARACALGDHNALLAFEASIWPNIDAVLARVRLPNDKRQDVLQELRLSLFVGRGAAPGRIAQYRGEGDLRRWLRAAALREAWRLGRKTRRELALDDVALASVAIFDGDPGLSHLKETCRAELKNALVAALDGLSPSDRTLLRQYHLDGLTVDELAALHRIHRATAARRVKRARVELTDAVLNELRKRLRLDDTQLQSVLRLVRSQLELSVDRLLATG
jgi:RNA polymerase sigma-70 factor, ECF subfamily